jgi:hypothetical protein
MQGKGGSPLLRKLKASPFASGREHGRFLASCQLHRVKHLEAGGGGGGTGVVWCSVVRSVGVAKRWMQIDSSWWFSFTGFLVGGLLLLPPPPLMDAGSTGRGR